MNLWPLLSQTQNRQQTAASAATELEMKVRRHDSHCYTATFGVSHNPRVTFSAQSSSSAAVFIHSVKTKKRTRGFRLGCQFFFLAGTVQLHNNNVRDCFPAGLLLRLVAKYRNKQSETAPRASPRPRRKLLTDSGHGNSPAPCGSPAPPLGAV